MRKEDKEMAYTSNMMRIDAERLRRFAAKNGGLAHISRQMGFGETYLSTIIAWQRMRQSTANQLSAMYGVPEDFFRARDTDKQNAAAPQVKQMGYALRLQVTDKQVFLLLEHDGEKVGSAYSKRKGSSELELTQAISYAAHMIYKFCEQKTLQESMEGK